MKWRPGDRVRVSVRQHDGHHRTPVYLKGKMGTIDRVQGAFPNPEERAYGHDGLPARPLYRVSFAESEVWADYRGRSGDRVCADLYEQWLEPAG